MNKELNLYVFVKTMINTKNIPSLQEVLPTKKQIIEHIKLQKPKEKFQLIKIELEKEKFDEIYREISKKTSSNKKNDFIIICLEDQKHPLIFISKKD